MSYTVFPYLLDLEQLKRLYGSSDHGLLTEIERKHKERFARNDEHFAHHIARGAPDLRTALNQIIDGTAANEAGAFQYVYGLELLCAEIGELLPNDLFQDTRGRWMEEVGITGPLLDSGPPIPIPTTPYGPTVGHLTVEGAAKQLAELTDEALAHREHIVQEGRSQYRLWLEEAVRTGKGIVAFYY